MQLLPLPDVVPDDRGLLCRQSRLGSIFGSTVLSAILIGAALFLRYMGAPWPVWGGAGAFAAFIVPLLLSDMAARLRPTSWVAWILPEGIWINLRSYQNSGSAAGEAAFLPYDEIAQARSHSESYTTPSSEGRSSTHWRVQSLELALHHGDTAALRDALAAERNAPPAKRHFLGATIASRASHFAVTAMSDDVVRIAWRGGRGNQVTPSLSRALEEIGRHETVGDATRVRRKPWHELSDAELNAQILQFVQSGDRIEAIQLLTRRRGYSTTEAHLFVEELAKRAT